MSHRPSWILFILGFVAFVTSFGAHVVAINLPVYAEQMRFGALMIGLLIAVYDFAELGAKPVFGAIADRTGMRATMLLGIAVFAIASLLFLVLDPKLLLVIRFLQGLGAAALSIVSAALVADYFPESRGHAFGVYNAIKGAGYVISPLVGGAIVYAANLEMVFVACAIVGGIAFVCSLLLPKPSADAEFRDDDDAISIRQFAEVIRDRTLQPWYGVIVVNMFLVSILFGFLPVYIHALGYTQLTAGVLVACATTSYVLVQPIAGRLADRFNPVHVILIGLILSALGVVLVPFTRGVALGIVAVIGGLGVGCVWTNSDTMVSNLAKERRMASTLGVAGSFKEFGDMVGPLFIGALTQAFGLTVSFVTCGVVGFASILLLHNHRGVQRGHGLPKSLGKDRG